MKRNVIQIIFWAIVLVLCTNCTKTSKIEIEKQEYWKHYLFSSPELNIVTNSIVVNDQLIVSVYGVTMIFDDFNSPPHRFGGTTFVGYDSKPALSEELSAHVSWVGPTTIHFRRHTEGLHGYHLIRARQFGEQFENYAFRTNINSLREIGAFNSQNRFVSVIADNSQQDGTTFNEHFVFVDILPHGPSGSGNIRISDFGVFKIPSWPAWRKNILRFSNIFVYNDKFYIAFCGTNGGIGIGPNDPDPGWPYGLRHYIEISPDGSIREFINHTPRREHIHTFFEFKGYLFAQLEFRQFIYTTDGENWTETTGLNMNITNYKEIDDYLFFYRSSQIYFIEAIGGNVQNMVLHRVQTGNISGKTISSINKFQDDLVITTSNGIFYQNIKKVINDAKYNNANNATDNEINIIQIQGV